MNPHAGGLRGGIGAALAAALVALAASCASEEESAPPPEEISSAALRSASYPSAYLEEGAVRLEKGTYEDSARRVAVFMLPEYAIGDLDSDGAPDAAVLLATNTGGSGTFEDLSAVLNRDGEPDAVAGFFLGDRVRVERIRIVEGTIEVEVTMHAPADPMCCPTMKTTRRFRFEDGALEEIDPPSEAPE